MNESSSHAWAGGGGGGSNVTVRMTTVPVKLLFVSSIMYSYTGWREVKLVYSLLSS